MAKTPKTELGARLKRVAHEAGFTAERLAEQLGVSPSAVWAWWAGRNEPSVDTLLQYAEATRVSVSYLLNGAEDSMGPIGSVLEWKLRFADLVAKGTPPADAIEKISGRPAPTEIGGIPLSELTDVEKTLMAGLNEEAGGDWSRLTPEQKAAVLHLVETMAEGNERPPPPEPPPREPDR